MNPAASANGNPGFVLASAGDKRRQGEREEEENGERLQDQSDTFKDVPFFPSAFLYLYRPIVVSFLTFLLFFSFFMGTYHVLSGSLFQIL